MAEEPEFYNFELGGWALHVKHNSWSCTECGHTRIHHLGFREPGCTYLGTCSCRAFAIRLKESA